MTSTAVANIDFLSSIPTEVLTASGTYGCTYALQLQSARAQDRLSNLREQLYEDISRERTPSLTSAQERVENHPDVIEARKQADAFREAVAIEQAEVGGIVFLPACDNLEEITKRLAALNKKAAKLGTEPITFEVTEEKLVLNYKTNDEDTRGWDFEHVFAVLKGATPKIPGFEFLATVTHTETGNVIKRIPAIAYGIRHNLDDRGGEFGDKFNSADSPAGQALSAIDLTKYHTTGNLCEQCGLHRERLDTFIVYNEETGETKQVGRNCLRDYTGLNNPEQVLKVLEQVWEFMRSMSGSRGSQPVLSTKTFLTHCAALVRDNGGYLKGLGHEAAENHYNWVNKRMTKDRPPMPMWIEPIPPDEQAAEAIIAWLPEWDESSEFASNVKIALAGTHVNSKVYGYAGAAFIARDKWLGRQRAVKAQATKSHVGTEGQRESFILTVKAIKWIANYSGFGPDSKPLIIMEDENGNEVKWFASDLPRIADRHYEGGEYVDQDGKVYSTDSPSEGGTYRVKTTVKRHEDDERWGKSTIVNRAKFETTINEEA